MDKENNTKLFLYIMVMVLLVVGLPLLIKLEFSQYGGIKKNNENFVVFGKEFVDGTKLLITRNSENGCDVSKESVGSITEMLSIRDTKAFEKSLANVIGGVFRVSSGMYIDDDKEVRYAVQRKANEIVLTFGKNDSEESFSLTEIEAKELLEKIKIHNKK